MIHTVSGPEALQRRLVVKSQGTGVEHWGTGFFGEMRCKEIREEPQALLTDMDCDEITKSHFHQVDQFHIFVTGSGKMGRDEDAAPLRVQYLDHHTGYGPIYAGPHGLSYFALRNRTDSGPTYLDQPGFRERLKPTKRRNRFTDPIVVSSEPILMKRASVALETLLTDEKTADGLAAYILRLGPGMSTLAPDPRSTGGHYYFVVNGSLERDGASLPQWSMLFADNSESPLEVRAGAKGLEMLILQFPRKDF